MQPREFHIWDFPEDRVRILFKQHYEFINKAIIYFGNRNNLGKYLGISPAHIYNWTKYNLYISLKDIKLIVRELKLDWLDIEREIYSYKGVSTSSPITNPKLPIKESPDLFSVITHILCDGSVNRNGIPAYTNTSKTLIDNFDNKLKSVFGEFKQSTYFGGGINKNVYQYRPPKIIIDLLESFYNINFYKRKEIPSIIFDLPREFSVAVVRAFADDEGCVDLNRRISFTQKDKEILSFLQKLLKDKLQFYQITEIKNKDNCHLFYIMAPEIEKYQKEIGFVHPEKKDRLRRIVYDRLNGFRTGQHNQPGKTREKLLNLLNDNVLSTYDMMKEININKSNLNLQIKSLENAGLVVKTKKIGQTIFWTRRK